MRYAKISLRNDYSDCLYQHMAQWQFGHSIDNYISRMYLYELVISPYSLCIISFSQPIPPLYYRLYTNSFIVFANFSNRNDYTQDMVQVTFRYLVSDFLSMAQNQGRLSYCMNCSQSWKYLGSGVLHQDMRVSMCFCACACLCCWSMEGKLARELVLKVSTFRRRRRGQSLLQTFIIIIIYKQLIQMSTEKALKEENDQLHQRIRKIQQALASHQHQHKKALLQSNTKLDFQTARANEYEQKYKSILQYKNQEESLQELDQQLREKENQILRLLSLGHQKAQETQQLYQEMEQLQKENAALNSDLSQIKEAALSAIMDKDATITQLTEKLQQLQNNEGVNNNENELKSVIIDLQEKYRQLEDRNETSRAEFASLLQEKEGEINELQERISQLKEKYEQRASRFEQDYADLQKHLQEVTALKDHEENIEEKYYHAEEKLRKTEKRLFELEQLHHDQLADKEQALQKAQAENQVLRASSEQLKELRSKIREIERQLQVKKRQGDELKERLQKNIQDLSKKVGSLQNEKKLLGDNFNSKQQQIDRLRNQLSQKEITAEPTLSKQKSIGIISPQKNRDQENILIQKLKRQNKDLQEANDSLKRKVEEQTRELQQSRQKLLQVRASDGASSEVNKLKVQIEQTNSYLKKVQNQMLIKKITHAQDENYWSIKQKKYKDEFEQLNKKSKKEISQLLERIDRIKKLVPKDKKTDYYQSGFK